MHRRGAPRRQIGANALHASRTQGAGFDIESWKVSRTVTEANRVYVADRGSWDHSAGESPGRIQVVAGSCPGRELELGGFEADHAEGDGRTVGFQLCTSGIVERRGLRGRVERDVDYGPEMYSVVMLKGERCQHLIECRRVGQVSRYELEDRSCPG